MSSSLDAIFLEKWFERGLDARMRDTRLGLMFGLEVPMFLCQSELGQSPISITTKKTKKKRSGESWYGHIYDEQSA